MKLDRRTLLIGGGTGVGLIVAYAAWPRRFGSGLQPGKGEQVFGHYLKIAPDGRVTVALPQVETGQGVWTALPQILADELGAAWETVAVEPAPASPVYANALAGELRTSGIETGERVTAGATSIRSFERPLREVGAVVRAMLCSAAARRWGVNPAECDTADGFVTHEGKRLPFGELAEAAAASRPPKQPVLRAAGTGKLAGQTLPRLDLSPKSDGSFRFAGDVRLPDMRYAAAALVPEGGQITGHNGGEEIIIGEGWIAALDDTSWAASERLKRAAPRIAGPGNATSEAVERILLDLLDGGEAEALLEYGDPDAARGRKVEARYRVHPALHLGLEPLTAIARLTNGRLEVWAPTQAPDRTRAAAGRAAGVAAADVLLYPMPIGAPDGRALHADAVPVAAALARRTRGPVQVVIAPGQSRRHDRVRAPAAFRLQARLDPDNRPVAWIERRAAATPPGEAAFPYAVPAVRLEQAGTELPLATGYLRGGEAAVTAFPRECFLDELARSGNFEPLAFRIALLGGQPRLAHVLQTAAAIGGWDGGGAGSSMGLACLSAYGSHIALLASASIGPDQSVQVDRLVAAVDCGRAVNPGLVRQQVEGGLLAGLARATAAAPVIRAGLVEAGMSAAPRLARTPAISVELIPSRADPGGVSGLGDAIVAPAVANAIASATGKRLRSLPFDPMSAA